MSIFQIAYSKRHLRKLLEWFVLRHKIMLRFSEHHTCIMIQTEVLEKRNSLSWGKGKRNSQSGKSRNWTRRLCVCLYVERLTGGKFFEENPFRRNGVINKYNLCICEGIYGEKVFHCAWIWTLPFSKRFKYTRIIFGGFIRLLR